MAKIRVRARAVDMLGRQQIAGIPTAIHELFKNAHDAYAARVDVDFFREDGLLILRDDGYGMTREEFEDRWLTLGTESKVTANIEETPWPKLLKIPRRPVMGEKGIGRLAIAAIGPQVLVVTRAIREDGLSTTTVCLVHWGVFEVPGIDLDEIEIPVIELKHTAYPDAAVVRTLAETCKRNLEDLGDRLPKEERKRIFDDLDAVEFDPTAFLDYIKVPGMGVKGHGTHFFVLPVHAMLEDDIDDIQHDIAPPLQKMLLGFGNTMLPGAGTTPLHASFRDHLRDGRVNELIGDNNFFLPEEFLSADHHFKGEFDAFGQFTGTVQLYGEPSINYKLPWEGAAGQETECGPFSINVAYVQGDPIESLVPPEEYARLTAKLNLIGGLYIYRDGIRVLPYGNSDYDFLKIESRRTKKASDWFFSYRRMFGAVDISYRSNRSLEEKAGREGFRANMAYRQFRAILENLFMMLAKDFLRKGAEHGDEFRRIREDLQERDRLLKKREEMAKDKKAKFGYQLDAFFADIGKGLPSQRAIEIEARFRQRLEEIATETDRDRAGAAILELEREFDREARELQKAFALSRPRGVSLKKQLTSDWQAYQKNTAKLESDVYMPLRTTFAVAVKEVIDSRAIHFDRRQRVEEQYGEREKFHNKEVKQAQASAEQSLTDLNTAMKASIKTAFRRVGDGYKDLMIEFQKTDVTAMSDDGFERYRSGLLDRMDRIATPERITLERLRDQLDSVAEAVREGESVIEMADAAEDETLFLRSELDTYSDFAQSGMALGIIQHEFSSTVRSVRENIRKLKPWADGTPELNDIHKSLRASFEHLDGYLTLFTPLNRRLYRSKVELGGEEIRKYLSEIFGDRLERHNITLSASDSFDAFTMECYPSTFLPVFINIVDNAIYWIVFERDSEHWINLEADGRGGLLVSNGGPGIDAKDVDRIFEFGETTKVSGRGMGLFISRRSLRKEGWDITLETTGRSNHPVFRIAPDETAHEEEET